MKKKTEKKTEKKKAKSKKNWWVVKKPTALKRLSFVEDMVRGLTIRCDDLGVDIDGRLIPKDVIFKDLIARIQSIERHWNGFELDYASRRAADLKAMKEEIEKTTKKVSLWSKIKRWFVKPKFESTPISWPDMAAVRAGNWSDPASWENCTSKFKR